MKKIFAILFAFFITFLCFSCEETTSDITTIFSSESTEEITQSSTDSLTSTTTTSTTTPEITTTVPTTATTTTTSVPVDSNPRSLSEKKNYILMNSGTQLDLSKCHYETNSEILTLADLTLSQIPGNIGRNGSLLRVYAKGVYFLNFTYGTGQIAIVLIAKNATETEYVLFQDSFTSKPNGSIPSNYTLLYGTASISNGKLVLSATGSNSSGVLLPSYLSVFGDYIIETDLTIQSASDPSRWAAFMFRYGSSGYFQMAVRQNAMAANGVEFAKWLNGGWNVTDTTSYTENFDALKTYRLRIDANDDVVKEYIDGTLLITSNIANDLRKGKLGMQAKGAVAAFNNIRVTLPESYIDEDFVDLSEIPAVYLPETGISLPPSVMTKAESLADLQAISQMVRPQILIMNVDESLNVVTPENEIILSLLDALQLLSGRVIPAFYVTNATIAEDLATTLRNYGIVDVFFISPNPQVILQARTASPVIRGLLQIAYNPLIPVLNDADRLEIRDTVNTCGAVGAVLPAEYSTIDTIDYMQNRFLTVFVDVLEKPASAMYQAVLNGTDGLLTSDFAAVYSFFALFPENTILRHPMIIAHRGLGMGAPENSIEGAILAYQSGADAIELDILLTTDGRLVVMHDSTTSRTTNGSLTVENSTLAQLKELVLLDSSGKFPGCQIPTLDEFFTAFKGLDVQLIIEIKSEKTQIVSVLDNLINTYGISGQVIVISKIVSQLERTRELIPEVSVGFLNQAITQIPDSSGCIKSVLNMIIPIKSSYNPDYMQLTEEFLMQLHYRGIPTYLWTLDVLSVLDNYYCMDVGGVTTGIMDYINDDPLFFGMTQTVYTVDLSSPVEAIALTGTTETLDGETASAIPKWIIVDAGGTGIQIDSSAHMSGFSSAGTAYILVYHQDQIDEGKTYRLFAEIVIVQVTE